MTIGCCFGESTKHVYSWYRRTSVYTHTHASHTRACTHSHTHAPTYTHACTHSHTHAPTYTHACTHTHTHACTHKQLAEAKESVSGLRNEVTSLTAQLREALEKQTTLSQALQDTREAMELYQTTAKQVGD